MTKILNPKTRPQTEVPVVTMLNMVQSLYVTDIIVCTQAQYDATPIKSPKTLYLIVNS